MFYGYFTALMFQEELSDLIRKCAWLLIFPIINRLSRNNICKQFHVYSHIAYAKIPGHHMHVRTPINTCMQYVRLCVCMCIIPPNYMTYRT